MTRKLTIEVDAESLLTAEEILHGADNPYERLDIPELTKNGKPGIIHFRPLSTADVMSFIKDGKTDLDPEGKIPDQDPEKQNDPMLRLMAKVIIHPDGRPMFSLENITRLRDMRMDVFTRIAVYLTGRINSGADDVKNALGGATEEPTSLASPDASPTV